MSKLWDNEPVLVLSAILILLGLFLIAIVDLSEGELAAVLTLATAVIGVGARSQVTPVSKIE